MRQLPLADQNANVPWGNADQSRKLAHRAVVVQVHAGILALAQNLFKRLLTWPRRSAKLAVTQKGRIIAKVKVDDRLLIAADRMYDAIDEVLKSLDASSAKVMFLPSGLRYQLQRAKAGYDAAMTEEAPS